MYDKDTEVARNCNVFNDHQALSRIIDARGGTERLQKFLQLLGEVAKINALFLWGTSPLRMCNSRISRQEIHMQVHYDPWQYNPNTSYYFKTCHYQFNPNGPWYYFYIIYSLASYKSSFIMTLSPLKEASSFKSLSCIT
jgi:hypothetical protein